MQHYRDIHLRGWKNKDVRKQLHFILFSFKGNQRIIHNLNSCFGVQMWEHVCEQGEEEEKEIYSIIQWYAFIFSGGVLKYVVVCIRIQPCYIVVGLFSFQWCYMYVVVFSSIKWCYIVVIRGIYQYLVALNSRKQWY